MEGVVFYLNKDPTIYKAISWHHSLTLSEIVRYLRDDFHIRHTQQCRLFDSTGTELWDDDLEYVNTKEYLFLSKGEDFKKSNCLLMYEEIRLLGKGGFGTVKLYKHKVTNKEVAIKFLSFASL